MKPKYQLSYYFRILINILIYIIFFIYIIYSIINAKSAGNIVFNIIIGVVIGGVAGLYEYLRINYDAATKRLIVDGNPNEALRFLNKVKKLDFFKTYETSCQMMNILALIDLRKFEEVNDYVKQLDEKGIENYDVEITARYGQFVAYGELGNKGKSNTVFKKLTSLRDQKDSKGRRRKGAFFFNWEVINGQHKNYDGDYAGAYNFLKDISETNMNLREVMHYLINKAIAAKNIKQNDIYNECKDRLLKICKNNQIMKDYIESI